MAAKAKDVDWLGVEADYRAGILTDRAIGQKYGVSHTAVRKRAKAEAWPRDLSERIKVAREVKVSKAAVSKKGFQVSPETERQVVEANADLQASVVLSHRGDIRALRRTIVGLAEELGALTNTELQEALHDLLEDDVAETDSETRKTALRKAYHAAMALGSRAGAGQKLAAALGTLIEKERQAHGIDKGAAGEDLLGFLKGLEAPRATA